MIRLSYWPVQFLGDSIPGKEAYLPGRKLACPQGGLTPAIKHDIDDDERQAGHAERD